MIQSDFSALDTFCALLLEAACQHQPGHIVQLYRIDEEIEKHFFDTLETRFPFRVSQFVQNRIKIPLGVDFKSFDQDRQVNVFKYSEIYGDNAAVYSLSLYEERVTHFLDPANRKSLKEYIVQPI